jgi:beta-glucosidase
MPVAARQWSVQEAASLATRFSKGFLWGAATASHQVEGGNTSNDWWLLEENGVLPHRSGEACCHYDRYEQDFDLARSLGHNAHRFSIEWSRIEPRPGEWDEAATAHYVEVVDALRDRGIEPIITLHHFTNPDWLADRGGWTRRDSVGFFARYVEYVATRLADRVRYWVTINEPTVYAKHAFVTGDWPPCRPGSWWSAARVLRNMASAHVRAYEAIHRVRPDAMVGLAHSAPYIVACNPRRFVDRVAAGLRDEALNRAFFRLLGRPARDALDFLGLNYYTRQVVRWRSTIGAAAIFGTECTEDHHPPARSFTSLGWEIHPPGLPGILKRFQRFGVPLMITENGIATSDEEERRHYLETHLEALALAVDEQVPVLGYLYWTLMDNYEWTAGREARFGLAEVNFSTQERRLRPVAESYRRLCDAHSAIHDITRQRGAER